MGGKTNELLLTDDERRVKLDSLLNHRFSMRGKLLLPTTRDYDALHTDKGLQVIGLEMCRWLGMKPNGLHFVYSDTTMQSAFVVNMPQKQIVINRQLLTHPYTVGGNLALSVVTYFIERYDEDTPDRSLVEYATIGTGLGIWILNALKPQIGIRQRVYHSIDGAWFHNEGMQLELYLPKQYAEQVAKYAHENRIETTTYLSHTIARCQYLLPEFVTKQSSVHLPESSLILRHKKAANNLWVKIILIALIISTGIIFGIYAFATKSEPLTGSKQAQIDGIAILKKSYDTCISEASGKQSTYDPNDLFMTRQVDATKSKCESLRNEYNYAVTEFKKSYPN